MDLNQERLIADHAKEMRSMPTKLLAIEEKHDEKLKIVEINHSNQMATMQNHLIAMEINHNKVIKDMEAG